MARSRSRNHASQPDGLSVRASEKVRMSVSRSWRNSGSSTTRTRGSTASDSEWSTPYSRSQACSLIVTAVTSQPAAQSWLAVSRSRYAELLAAGGKPMAR